ncbi:MAG: sugar ABC transporter substrate-binding protein [Pseudomonadota bacterium]|nr:sugar ABC transporter substrate-binding protein [Pseudomonadota bacterium]
MKRFVLALAASAVMTGSAMAQNIAVSMAYFDDNFLTILREAMTEQAKELGVNLQFEDAQGDVGKQLSHMQNFIAQKVDAMVVNPVDTSATPQMTKLAQEAGIPLVYVNRQPNEPTLPEGVVYVGSDENISGKMQGEAIAKMLEGKGNVAIMMGELATNAAQLRTEGVEKTAAENPEMKIVEKQTANFQRNEAIDLMNNWLVSGTQIDAIAANNDEMAIGAIIALQQAGKDPKELVIAGIDATPDALVELKRGNLDITVFQDAKGQGKAVVDTAVKLIKGEKVDSFVMVPWELVTQENYEEFLNK